MKGKVVDVAEKQDGHLDAARVCGVRRKRFVAMLLVLLLTTIGLYRLRGGIDSKVG